MYIVKQLQQLGADAWQQWTRNAGSLIKKFSIPLFLISPGYATELSPWFSPLWEFEFRTSYAYERETRVQTPLGSFDINNNLHFLHFSLSVSPWFDWNVEAEARFAHTTEIGSTFEAFVITGRYSWLDDIVDDPYSFVTGVSLFFPSRLTFRDFGFWYHGKVNAELHASIGREFEPFRLWIYGGLGIAERGSPWFHGIGGLEWDLTRCYSLAFYVDSLVGFGGEDIIPDERFDGYASIQHRSVFIETELSYEVECFGTWNLAVWYYVYAHNYPENSYGVALELLLPFSF